MGWPERLDAMERQVEDARQAVQGQASVAGEELPAADGPVPPHLVGRATSILAATRQEEAAVADALARISHRLTRLRSASHAAGDLADQSLPAYVDTRA
jgi:hypothetical protein